MTAPKAPVLVVGGRTTGLMMAAELARHGASVRIVDKSPGIDPHSRATILHSRTLEILHGLGIAQPLVQGAQPLNGICLYANGRRIARSEELPVDSPFPRSVARSQAKTEKVLEAHLNRLGVQVERSTQLTALEPHGETVRATLQLPDGSQQITDAPWLVGCDGARSTVRQLTEGAFPGEADPYPYMLADVVVDGPHDPADAYMFLHDEGDLFLFILDEGRRLVVASQPPGSDLSQPPTLEQMQQIVIKRGLPELRLSDPRWLAHFHIQYRLAPHYRHGRVFLAGDAAHVHSLIGGHGMNTGMQDAHNLAWKLALVIRGVVPEAWLDSYETERRRVAEDVIATTKLVTDRAELFADLSSGQREGLLKHMFVPPSEITQFRSHTEEIDLDYRSSPLCVESDGEFAAGPHAGSRAPDAGPILVEGAERSFLEVLCSPRHLLVLFAGSADEPTAEVIATARAAQAEHANWIDVVIVASAQTQLKLPSGITLVEDPQQSLHARYGADSCCLYLIRPDGYLAYRSRRLESLSEYLARVL